MQLTSPLLNSPWVSARQYKLLDALGVRSLGGLLAYLPMRHERLEPETTIARMVTGTIASTRGEITALREIRRPKYRINAVILDETGRLDVSWFHAQYLRDKLAPGVRVRVQGQVKSAGGKVQMFNPMVELLPEAGEEPPIREGRVRPVYPASEQLGTREIEKIIRGILPVAMPLVEDHLPQPYRIERSFPALAQAYRMQHQPADEEEVAVSRRRLAYDELLLMQLGVHMKRSSQRARFTAPRIIITPEIDRRIRARFPFDLTRAQERAVVEITRDMASGSPTNRLLQGDVGSGKTAAAVFAMLATVAAGHQAAIMAPTEILAEQHAMTLSRWLEGSRVRVELLTGAATASRRDVVLAGIADGSVGIAVGTHALIGEGVKFKSLGLAVIDEQHRFGVSQRASLRSGNLTSTMPHVLVMTATPIPRSLALTLFGELDVSVIDELPPGRTPVTSRLLASAQRASAYKELARRIARGEQGYIVVPAVEPGDDQPSAAQPVLDVGTVLRAVRERHLAGARVEAMHGQMPRDQRSAVMDRFRQGQLDAIVSTTVIEVGVDVPNATMMIVEQADRFGLAQLHQLRGRVGRGKAASLCVAISDPASPEAQARLEAFVATTDGFVLAEKDLELRGMGDYMGLRQSGSQPFRVASLPKDRALLELARRDAADWIDRSPKLALPEEALLRSRVIKAHAVTLGLADVV
jgi:ATP-dependent DNA helicase RecG